MKKSGILHSDLAAIVAGMGHGDKLVICDCGYPIPHDRPVADVILTVGVPGLVQTLKVVLAGAAHRRGDVAKEAEQRSPAMLKQIETAIGTVPLKKMTHMRSSRSSAARNRT